MPSLASYRTRVIAPIVRACALGLLLWSCTSSPQEQMSPSYSCAPSPPPADFAGCTVDADCTTVARGCYCGAQPVNGVARKYAATAQACEQTAAMTCTRGCANQPGMVTDDGTMVDAGTILAARCDLSGPTGVCKSFVPPPGSGSGEPPPTGW